MSILKVFKLKRYVLLVDSYCLVEILLIVYVCVCVSESEKEKD